MENLVPGTDKTAEEILENFNCLIEYYRYHPDAVNVDRPELISLFKAMSSYVSKREKE